MRKEVENKREEGDHVEYKITERFEYPGSQKGEDCLKQDCCFFTSVGEKVICLACGMLIE